MRVESFEAFKVSGIWMACINGRTRRLEEWCKDFGISYGTVRSRINRNGWPVRSALLVKSAGVADRPALYAKRLGVCCFKTYATEYLASGKSQGQLAEKLGEGRSTVRLTLKKIGAI